jgi:hypothetical protein
MRHVGFVDPAGGSGGDSMTLAVAHAEPRSGTRVGILDAVRERRPPFSPEAVVTEFAALLHVYGIDRIVGDRYAGEWPREQFRKHGIAYEPSNRTKSDIYVELLPLLNSGRVELLDHPRLVAQLGALERRTSRGGRDTVDHAPGGHDDVANVVAGALVLAAARGCTFCEDEECDGVAPPFGLMDSPEVREWLRRHPDPEDQRTTGRSEHDAEAELWSQLHELAAVAEHDPVMADRLEQQIRTFVAGIEQADPTMGARLRAIVTSVEEPEAATDAV